MLRLWIPIKDNESALQAIKMAGYLCVYWASFYLFDLVNLKNHPLEFDYFPAFIIYILFVLIIYHFMYYFYGSFNFQVLRGYSVFTIFCIIINLTLLSMFIWLGIRIMIKKKVEAIPCICVWTWIHLVLQIPTAHGIGWVISITLFVLSINAWRGWRFFHKREWWLLT